MNQVKKRLSSYAIQNVSFAINKLNVIFFIISLVKPNLARLRKKISELGDNAQDISLPQKPINTGAGYSHVLNSLKPQEKEEYDDLLSMKLPHVLSKKEIGNNRRRSIEGRNSKIGFSSTKKSRLAPLLTPNPEKN